MNDERPAGGAPATTGDDAVFDLEHLALIAVRGADCASFLQGQLTSDVNAITRDRAALGAWCSPKGRVLCCLLVFRHDDALMLQLPASLLESTLKRMRMFVLRADVTLDDASGAWMRMGVLGARAKVRLEARIGRLPERPHDVVDRDGITVIRLAGSNPRYELVGARRILEPLWQECLGVASEGDAGDWERLDIESGIASIGPATSDAFVPQMINLDRVGAVSFTKGCYVGQEIVARTQHLGRIKRRMYRARLTDASAPAPGVTLQGSAGDTPAKAQIVNAQPAAGGGFEVLAVMPIETGEAAAGSGLALDGGGRLTLETLPYALEDEIA